MFGVLVFRIISIELFPAYEAPIVALVALLKKSICDEFRETPGDILQTLAKKFKVLMS